MRISDWSSDVCSSDLAVGIGGGHRRIGQVAGRVAVAGLADVSQQLAVARAPLKAEGFFQALCRAAVAAGNAAVGIVDHAPGAETVAVAVGAQHPEPVDQDADALLEHVGVEARVAGGRLVPDLAAGAFGGAEAGFAVVEARPGLRRRDRKSTRLNSSH